MEGGCPEASGPVPAEMRLVGSAQAQGVPGVGSGRAAVGARGPRVRAAQGARAAGEAAGRWVPALPGRRVGPGAGGRGAHSPMHSWMA